MRHLTRSRGRCGAVVVATLLVATGAHAAEPERNATTPVSSWLLVGKTEAQINAEATAKGARVIDIEIEEVGAGPTFAAVLVKSEGPYASQSWWYHGKTSGELNTLVGTHKARIIDLEVYLVAGQARYAAVMVPLASRNWWWWAAAQPADLTKHFSDNNARPVDLDCLLVGTSRSYSAVAFVNTGADASPFYWYVDLSEADVKAKVTQHGARIVDLERYLVGTDVRFAVVLAPNASPAKQWWWYLDKTEAELNALATTNKARIVDIEAYVAGGGIRYAAVMLENSNVPADGGVPDGAVRDGGASDAAASDGGRTDGRADLGDGGRSDAWVPIDAGLRDAAPKRDVPAAGDAGSMDHTGGCGCEVGASGSTAALGLLGLALALAAFSRGTRRRS
ncbi:MAG: hypothetical protein IT371_20745 [Deltaproteobacteria bacterium]|nr:hypothetical protein [Deltaproteobacteria bacterium]